MLIIILLYATINCYKSNYKVYFFFVDKYSTECFVCQIILPRNRAARIETFCNRIILECMTLGVAPQDRRLLAIIYFAFFTSGMTSTLIGAMLPDIKDEHSLSYILVGALTTFHQIGNVAAVLIAGFLPYIIGRKKSSCALGSGIFMGLALMTLTGSPALLLAAFALTGVGRGTMSNIGNVVVSDVTANKGAGLNLLHATFAVGAMTSPFIAIACTRLASWRMAAWIVAACNAGAVLCLARSSLSDVPPRKEKAFAVGAVPFYKSASFWLNTAIMFFYLCGEAAICGWLVTYFKETGLMGMSFAQSTQSWLWIMVMAGRLLCASLSGKVSRNRLIFLLALAMTACFVLMICTDSIALVIIGILGLGLSMSGIYPSTLGTMDKAYTSDTAAMGVCMSAATVGGIIMPVTVGIVAECWGIASGISTIAVALGAMLLLTVVKLARRM